jgi:FkbM family methyltransferase
MIDFNFKHTIHASYLNALTNFYNIFSRYIKNDYWTIDIGAALGDTTLVLAKLVGENGKVLAFEPSINYDLLLENIKNNPNLSDRIRTYKLGAYNRDCIKKMVTNPSMDNGGITDDLFLSEHRSTNTNHSYDIDVVNMNSFLFREISEEERRKVKFIKIDTEGLDFLILNNLKPFIDKYKPILFIEWWNNEMLSDVIFDIVDQIGYNSIRDDNFEKVTAYDFNKKSENMILIPK